MTSSKDMKAGSVLQSGGEERRRAPLDQLPPPANSNKPLTPFSIEDILNKPSVKKSVASICPPRVLEKVTSSGSARNGITTPSSPLCALEELASKTFKGLEVSVIQAAEGTDWLSVFLGQIGFFFPDRQDDFQTVCRRGSKRHSHRAGSRLSSALAGFVFDARCGHARTATQECVYRVQNETMEHTHMIRKPLKLANVVAAAPVCVLSKRQPAVIMANCIVVSC